ncbi:Uncharacterised protein [Segatella copri]|nr:Uncharacterised protein [Segatella copri]
MPQSSTSVRLPVFVSTAKMFLWIGDFSLDAMMILLRLLLKPSTSITSHLPEVNCLISSDSVLLAMRLPCLPRVQR